MIRTCGQLWRGQEVHLAATGGEAGEVDAIVERGGLLDLVEIKTGSLAHLRGEHLEQQLSVLSDYAEEHIDEFTGQKILVIHGYLKPTVKPHVKKYTADTGFEVVYLP